MRCRWCGQGLEISWGDGWEIFYTSTKTGSRLCTVSPKGTAHETGFEIDDEGLPVPPAW